MGGAAPVADVELQKDVDAFAAHNGNKTRASDARGVSRSAFIERIKRANRLGIVAGGSTIAEAPEGSPAIDSIERHRLTSEIEILRASVKTLTKRVADAEDHRASILGLEFLPAEPTVKPPSNRNMPDRPSSCIFQTFTLAKSSIVKRSWASMNTAWRRQRSA